MGSNGSFLTFENGTLGLSAAVSGAPTAKQVPKAARWQINTARGAYQTVPPSHRANRSMDASQVFGNLLGVADSYEGCFVYGCPDKVCLVQQEYGKRGKVTNSYYTIPQRNGATIHGWTIHGRYGYVVMGDSIFQYDLFQANSNPPPVLNKRRLRTNGSRFSAPVVDDQSPAC